jgi:hypothetical protein
MVGFRNVELKTNQGVEGFHQPNAHTTQPLNPEFGHDSTPISKN